jgi:hypothetical protein
MTLELLISVVIMSMMSVIVLSANANLSSRLEAENLAQLIALSVREAQVRALSATVPIGETIAGNVPGYGVYLRLAGTPPVITFSDSRNFPAGVPYTTGNSIILTGNDLGHGFQLTAFAAKEYLTLSDVVPSPTEISIFFHRPKSDAYLYYDAGGGMTRAASVTLTIGSPKGVTKTITVTATGQITVQ